MAADGGNRFQPMYPDVLGAVTGGPRIYLDKLQVAVGLSPQQAYVNQPFEAVIVLQNMVDQNMQVKIGLQLPKTDRKGDPVIIEAAKSTVTLGLTPGEVGVLRIPIVAHPPTQPGKGFPVRVAIRYRTPEPGVAVRPPGGGAPPSVLTISPFKLQVLREIEFTSHTWNESAEIITSYFDVVPKRIALAEVDLKPHYETLWVQEHMPKEVELARARLPEARRLAAAAEFPSSYPWFVTAVEERFAAREMPLHPAEAIAIAKMMAYTTDEAPTYETKWDTEATRWFHTVCQVLAHDERMLEVDRNELLATFVFDAVLYDAVLLAFQIIKTRVKEDLGDLNEQVSYATRAVAWAAGFGAPDLNYIYLPLVMGGIAVNRMVKISSLENPWEMLDGLREATRGRMRLVKGETVVVFNMLNELLEEAEKLLRYQRVPRT